MASQISGSKSRNKIGANIIIILLVESSLILSALAHDAIDGHFPDALDICSPKYWPRGLPSSLPPPCPPQAYPLECPLAFAQSTITHPDHSQTWMTPWAPLKQ